MITTAPAPSRISVAAHVDEPGARFRDLLGAEWIKLWSLRSTYASLSLIIVSAIGFCVYASLADYRNWPSYGADRRSFFDPIRDAFPQQAYLFVLLAASSVGATAVASEYATGLIRTSLAAVPARRALIAAKIMVVAGVMTIVGAIAAGSAFAISQAILSGRGAGWSITHPYALRATAASALIVPVVSVVGMGIGALVRNTAATIVTTTAVLLLMPFMVGTNRHWEAVLNHSLPVMAWERLIELPQFARFDGPYPASVTGAWIVFGAWPLVAAAVALIAVRRRDV
jgi:ABC-type transport system involved in multi-copper enzyme maturation permease subunit